MHQTKIERKQMLTESDKIIQFLKEKFSQLGTNE